MLLHATILNKLSREELAKATRLKGEEKKQLNQPSSFLSPLSSLASLYGMTGLEESADLPKAKSWVLYHTMQPSQSRESLDTINIQQRQRTWQVMGVGS